MSIRPVDLSGMIQRTQDIGNIKHAEDSRPVADQYNIEVRQEKQESDLSHKVQDPEQKDNQEFRYDAREKGNTRIALRHDCSSRRTGNRYTDLPDGCGEIQRI